MTKHPFKAGVLFLASLCLVVALSPGIGESQKQTQFSIATGPSTAAYYALGAGMSQMAKKTYPRVFDQCCSHRRLG